MGEIVVSGFLVVSTACVLLVGLVFLVLGIAGRNKLQIKLSIILPLIYAAVAGSIVFAIVVSLTPKAGMNVAPGEVNFLRLPSTAKEIFYWRDGVSFVAEFTIAEKDFLKLFPKFNFSEIIEPLEMQRAEFVGPEQYPLTYERPSLVISNGLYYEKRYSNNGGYEIAYDRSDSRAHYRYSVR